MLLIYISPFCLWALSSLLPHCQVDTPLPPPVALLHLYTHTQYHHQYRCHHHFPYTTVSSTSLYIIYYTLQWRVDDISDLTSMISVKYGIGEMHKTFSDIIAFSLMHTFYKASCALFTSSTVEFKGQWVNGGLFCQWPTIEEQLSQEGCVSSHGQ